MDFVIPDLLMQIVRQGSIYIAYSHKLDIATTGKSEKQAMDTFGNLLKIFTGEIVKEGVPIQRLTDLGWTCRGKRWTPPSAPRPRVRKETDV